MLYGQTSPSCCQASSIKAFTDLANDISFVMTHETPLPYILENPQGKNISFPVSGDKDGQGYYIAGNKKNKKWIFVFQEWWGLNDYIRMQSDLLHASFPDAHILALDLYDGKVATTREEASSLMQGASSETIKKIITAASVYAGKKAKTLATSWKMAARFSTQGISL